MKMVLVVSLILFSLTSVTMKMHCPGVIVIDRCYWLITSNQSASGTHNICRRQNGEIAIFDSWEYVQHLGSIYNHMISNYEYLWIGVKYETSNSDWVNYDGQPLSWVNWLPYEPVQEIDKTCVRMSSRTREYRWKNTFCTDMLPGVCQATLDSSETIDITTGAPSASLNTRIDISRYDGLVFKVSKTSPVEIHLHSDMDVSGSDEKVKVTIGSTGNSSIKGCDDCTELSFEHSEMNFTYNFITETYECDCDELINYITTAVPESTDVQTTAADVLTTAAETPGDVTPDITTAEDVTIVVPITDNSTVATPTTETVTSGETVTAENVTNTVKTTENITVAMESTENVTALIASGENVTISTPTTENITVATTTTDTTTSGDNVTSSTPTTENMTITTAATANVTVTMETSENVTNSMQTTDNMTITTEATANVTVTMETSENVTYSMQTTDNVTVAMTTGENATLPYNNETTTEQFEEYFTCEALGGSSKTINSVTNWWEVTTLSSNTFNITTGNTTLNSTPLSSDAADATTGAPANESTDDAGGGTPEDQITGNSTETTTNDTGIESSTAIMTNDTSIESSTAIMTNDTSIETSTLISTNDSSNENITALSTNATGIENNSTVDSNNTVCNCSKISPRTAQEMLNSSDYVTLWIKWIQGWVQVGVGSVLGDFIFMEYNYTANSSLNYMTVGSSQTASWQIDVINGDWCTWSFWFETNQTNAFVRNRTCECPAPSNGGEYCVGESYDNFQGIINGTICPEPPPVANAYRILGNGEFRSITYYSCYNTFYRISGDLTRQCGPTGQYSGEAPVCATDCEQPPSFYGANLFTLTGSSFGDVAEYKCDETFVTVPGMTLKCGENTWSGDAVMCLEPRNLAANRIVTSKRYYSRSVSPFTTVDAANVTQCTCYSTGLTPYPYLTIELGGVYDIYKVEFTFPNTSDAMTHNISILVGHSQVRKIINPIEGSKYKRFSLGYGSQLSFRGHFPNSGILTLCNIDIRGRKRIADCGRPIFSYPKIYTQDEAKEASFSCANDFYNQGGSASSGCGVSREWTSNKLACTEDPNLSLFLPNITMPDDIDVLTDDIDDTCTNSSIFIYSFNLDKVYEVSRVVVTVSANITWENLAIHVIGTFKNSSCEVLDKDFPTVRTFRCQQFPIGRTVVIESTDEMALCEVRIFGIQWSGKALECVRESKGWDYKGHWNFTMEGEYCVDWNNVSCSSIDLDFADENPADVGNYCRNPTNYNRGSPWCYTADCLKQDCAVPSCNKICSNKDDGFDYIGKITTTRSGTRCSSFEHGMAEQPFIAQSFPRGERKTYCRNPGRSHTKVWCYTKTNINYEECYIPTCPTVLEEPIFLNRTLSFDPVTYRECFKWTTTRLADDKRGFTLKPENIGSICGNSDDITLFCQSQNTINTTWIYIYIDCFLEIEESSSVEFSLSTTSLADWSTDLSSSTSVVPEPSLTSSISSTDWSSSYEELTSSQNFVTSSQNVMTSSQNVMTSSQNVMTSSQYSVMSSQTPEVTSSQNIVTSSQTPASSSVAPTTTYYNPLIPPSGRKMCPCRCKPRKTPEEIRKIIKSINDDLHVDVEKLSATIAKKNSAEDNRISSISLGVSSILLVAGFIGVFVFPDFLRVAIATKEFVSWLLSRRKNKDETFEMTSDC